MQSQEVEMAGYGRWIILESECGVRFYITYLLFESGRVPSTGLEKNCQENHRGGDNTDARIA